MLGLLDEFNGTFCLETGKDSSLAEANMRLRYQVWCLENDYFDFSDFDESMECDEYDSRSVYAVVSNKNHHINIATTRIILHDKNKPQEKFPVEQFPMLRRHDRDYLLNVPREKVGEISRFCVSKSFRRRAGEKESTHGITPGRDSSHPSGKRNYSQITLGLFRGVFSICLQYNLEHLYALMEPALLRIIRRYGVHFTPIGPCVNYYGIRQPCLLSIDSAREKAKTTSKEIYDFVCAEQNLILPQQHTLWKNPMNRQ
ncbi:MAG: PEP-CTERM/exosortase system-associated acyltransferase [Gammaproteobacteria bacterium]|nr:PEP-CTERM/exosortase system-associated acyltransferase [Gammaproteobacteria bacterium]